MKTYDLRNHTKYSPLIPAMEAILTSPKDTPIEIILDNKIVSKSLKEYLIERQIGFREIYDQENIILQFTV